MAWGNPGEVRALASVLCTLKPARVVFMPELLLSYSRQRAHARACALLNKDVHRLGMGGKPSSIMFTSCNAGSAEHPVRSRLFFRRFSPNIRASDSAQARHDGLSLFWKLSGCACHSDTLSSIQTVSHDVAPRRLDRKRHRFVEGTCIHNHCSHTKHWAGA
ncbi:hypothetical protein K491DRAFT_499629 [Lophiostoma macrostomum CBS 122681]|uniref:Uncharacterized protein n=1 Tax=Lophiostoma macrostomum CBS 122681 TaxID=1314788 RepID=A0A6A6T1F5_9PLEO|nr:hypothetical protein K491DRAFT_499629 [Lophiostoma macrostomum CBS 122681]